MRITPENFDNEVSPLVINEENEESATTYIAKKLTELKITIEHDQF